MSASTPAPTVVWLSEPVPVDQLQRDAVMLDRLVAAGLPVTTNPAWFEDRLTLATLQESASTVRVVLGRHRACVTAGLFTPPVRSMPGGLLLAIACGTVR